MAQRRQPSGALGYEPTTIGQPASFAYTPSALYGPPLPAPVVGYPGGGPPTASQFYATAAGQATGADQASYAASVAQAPPHRNPIFWAFAFVVVGAVGLAHHAHVSVRG